LVFTYTQPVMSQVKVLKWQQPDTPPCCH